MMEPVIPIHLGDWLSHCITAVRGRVRKRLTWFTAVCSGSECMTRGPMRPSRDGAIAAALSQGWKCEQAAQRDPKLTCPECLDQLREEQASAGPRPTGFAVGTVVRFKRDFDGGDDRHRILVPPHLVQLVRKGNWVWCVRLDGSVLHNLSVEVSRIELVDGVDR